MINMMEIIGVMICQTWAWPKVTLQSADVTGMLLEAICYKHGAGNY
jgi:hypothetical protein